MPKFFSILILGFLLSGCGLELGYPDGIYKSAEDSSDTEDSAALRIFLTAASTTGDLGGIAGADAFCQNDANKPSSGTYKAMLVDGSTRIATAGVQADWVLKANQKYAQASGLVIGTTNSNALFDFRLKAGFGTADAMVWTGLGAGWTTGSHCSGWTTQTAVAANAGQALHIVESAIFGASATCDMQLRLYCVEQ